jgi:hypothetical protein
MGLGCPWRTFPAPKVAQWSNGFPDLLNKRTRRSDLENQVATKSRVHHEEFGKTEWRTADPSTPLPRIPCRTWWRCCTLCALLYGRAHARLCLGQRGRKSGYAPVEMTIHLGNDTQSSHTKLSSRPKRSEVEGSAVRPSVFPNSSWTNLTA